MDFADVFNAIEEHMNGMSWTIYFPTTYPNGDGGRLHLRVEYAD